MPKSQNINPKVVRKPQFIEFGKIPVNQYNKTIEEEKKVFSKEDFLRIYLDMVVIREFETMLNPTLPITASPCLTLTPLSSLLHPAFVWRGGVPTPRPFHGA